MGFLDKVKEQAATATAVAKDAAQKGQAKLDDMQAKRGADALLRDLGVAVYAGRTDRSAESTPADIEKLVAALREHEATNGPIILEFESALLRSPAPGSAAPPPPPDAGPTTPPPAAKPPPPGASKPPPPVP